jgi:serine protease Do
MGPGGDEDHEGPRGRRDDEPDDAEPDGAEPDDDELDDDAPRGGPPDRMDRLWVHPAELSPAELSPVRPSVPRRSRLAGLALPLAAGALGALATVVVLGLVGAFDGDGNDPPVSRAEVRAAVDDDTISALTDGVAPGLVVVTVKDDAGSRQSTGVCVRHRGEILTSAQTLGASTTAQVTTPDGETITATVVGRDDVTGLVLLTTDRPLSTAALAESPSRTGDSVWVFGAHPAGEASPWMSDGIVSTVDAVVAVSPGPMTGGLIESDALATSWAAGGALVDRTGAVTGIVLWPVDGRPSSYAVPIGRAIAIANELREHGSVAHSVFDATMQDTPAGPVVTDVPAGSSAERDGVAIGDLVLEIAGRDVTTAAEVHATAHAFSPGAMVAVRVQRGAEPVELDVELAGARPEEPAAEPTG